jgi:acetyl-CoA hydrolase
MGVGAALDLIPDRSRVYVAPFGAVPTTMVDAMVEQRHRWTRIETVAEYLFQPLATFQHPNDPFVHCSLQPSTALVTLRRHDAGGSALRVVPSSTSRYAAHLAPGGPLSVDVAVVQVSPPDSRGRFSLGIVGGPTAEVVRSAPIVIAEVNPAMPLTRGVTECDRSDFDALVEVEHPLLEGPVPERSELAAAVASHVVDLVPEQATLEYGIGAIPDAVLAALADRHDLGIHSGMLGDAVIDLIDSGVVTGRAKTVDPGLHITCALIGSERLYRWIDQRDDVVVVTAGYSHGIPTLARQGRFCAINSAIEVALDGSVNAEVAAGRVVAGPGGQPDFACGAALAPGGVAIVAMPSTAARGRVSRIVAEIGPGRPITVPRHLADKVVTEQGVADLRGVDVASRADRMLSIAHPDRRDGIVSTPARAY